MVRRYLGRFGASSDHFDLEIDVSHVPFEHLKRIFSPPATDPMMYYCYDVDRSQAAALQKYVDEILDLDHFQYQLQAESAE